MVLLRFHDIAEASHLVSIFLDGVEFRYFDHIYAVSREGKFLRYGEPFDGLRIRPDGYFTVGRKRLAHRVVASCWCERPEGASLVHHKNHDKGDNRAVNLEWVSPKEHVGERHRDTIGRHQVSEETRHKLREYRLGRTTSEMTKLKQQIAAFRLGSKPPRRPMGAVMGEEFREKCRLNSTKSRACVVDGVSYRSFQEASLARGEKPRTLRRRCLSPNFPNYQLGSS